jgi:hypothetical protein
VGGKRASKLLKTPMESLIGYQPAGEDGVESEFELTVGRSQPGEKQSRSSEENKGRGKKA